MGQKFNGNGIETIVQMEALFTHLEIDLRSPVLEASIWNIEHTTSHLLRRLWESIQVCSLCQIYFYRSSNNLSVSDSKGHSCTIWSCNYSQTAYTLAVRLTEKVRFAYRLYWDSIHLWRDSVIVLFYVCNKLSRFGTFVASRMLKI